MSTKHTRSKTGCLTCKNRRKKCDETRPVCERCTKAGMTCLGYSYLDNPSQKVAKIRSKAALRVEAATADANDLSRTTSSQASTSVTGRNPLLLDAHKHPLNSFDPIMPQSQPSLSETDFQMLLAGLSPDELLPSNTMFDFPMSQFGSTSGLQAGHASTSTSWGENMNQAEPDYPTFTGLPTPSTLSDPPDSSSQQMRLGIRLAPKPNSSPSTYASASPFDIFPSPAQPLGRICASTPTSHLSMSPAPDLDRDDDTAAGEDLDPEGIREIVVGTPTLDPAVQSNSLPFVLQSYANWMTRVVVEPLRMAPWLKRWVTARFTSSGDSQLSITMFSGLLHAMWTKGVAATAYMQIASLLNERTKRRVIQARSELQLGTKSKDDLHQALYESLEMISILGLTARSGVPLALLEETAPLFRRACPEPPGELIDLPSNISYGRQMLFRYKVDYDPNQFFAASATEHNALQWLNGVPDHLLFLFARMSMLRDDYGTNVDPVTIEKLAQEVRDFKPQPSFSTDAFLSVARLAVQEFWRLSAYAYLYMALGGANAQDDRIESVSRTFMRLLDRTKPGRIPDAYVTGPMLLVGIATNSERDRAMIRRRFLGIRECAGPGTCGNDVVLVLDDIWSRSRIERRPAVWEDLRIAYSKMLGYDKG